jgi:hypothetical protein
MKISLSEKIKQLGDCTTPMLRRRVMFCEQLAARALRCAQARKLSLHERTEEIATMGDDMSKVMGIDERLLQLEERVARLEGKRPQTFRDNMLKKSEPPMTD